MENEKRVIGKAIKFEDLQDGDFVKDCSTKHRECFYVLKVSNEVAWLVTSTRSILCFRKENFGNDMVLSSELQDIAIQEFSKRLFDNHKRLSFKEIDMYVNGQELTIYMKSGITFKIIQARIVALSDEYVEFSDLNYPHPKYNYSKKIYDHECIIFADIFTATAPDEDKCPSHESAIYEGKNEIGETISEVYKGSLFDQAMAFRYKDACELSDNGIHIFDKLAEQLSLLEGRKVTISEVGEKIKKGLVSKTLVADVMDVSCIDKLFTLKKTDWTPAPEVSVAKAPNEDAIREIMGAMTELLLEKNRRYGDSAITPKNIFSKLPGEAGIMIRLDDKISRIMNSDEVRLNDVCDLIGYETLLLVARKVTRQDILKLID